MPFCGLNDCIQHVTVSDLGCLMLYFCHSKGLLTQSLSVIPSVSNSLHPDQPRTGSKQFEKGMDTRLAPRVTTSRERV